MAKDIGKNELARKILQFFWFLGGDVVDERVLTDPKDFQTVFEKVMNKTKEKFEELRSVKEAAKCPELLSLLEKMEKGEQVDEDRLRDLLGSYATLQRKAGTLLSALQRWQVAENVDRVGGKGDPNMLDQVTRIGEKTFGATLRDLAPYGVFRTRSYRAEDGRLILLAPAPDTSKLTTQLKEGGKAYLTLEAAILLPILHRMAMRVPLLGRVFRPWYVRLGVPVALAEASLAGAEGGARVLTMSNAIDAVEQSVNTLEVSEGGLSPETAKEIGNMLFEHLLIAMQAAEGTHPGTPRQDLTLEAHIYTNQILTALGYPPYHEISPSVLPGKIDQDMSPEMQQYLTVKLDERAGITKETRDDLQKLYAKIKASQRGASAPTEIQESPVDQLIREEKLPPIFSREKLERILLEAAHSPEFREKGKMEKALKALGETEEEQTQAVFALAGDTFFILSRLQLLDFEYRDGERGNIRNKIPSEKLDPLEKEVKRLVKKVPLTHILATIKYLENHEPSNKEIAKIWYRKEYPSGFLGNFLGMAKRGVDNDIDKRFGTTGNRSGLGEKFLRDYADLWYYSKVFLEDTK